MTDYTLTTQTVPEMPEKRGPNQLWEARFDPATGTVRAFCKVCDASFPGHTFGCALAASEARVKTLERGMKIVANYFGDDDPPEDIKRALGLR